MKIVRNTVLVLLSTYLLFHSCSNSNSNTEVVKLQYLSSVSELSDSTYLYSVSTITAKDNAMYVVESSTNRVITLELGSNTVKSSFGGVGSGPEEFRYISSLIETDDTLFVLDGSLKAFKLFTKDGTFIEARETDLKTSFPRVGRYKDKIFILGAEHPKKVVSARNVHTGETYFEFDNVVQKNESIKNIPIMKRYDRRYIVVADTFVVSFPIGELFASVNTIHGKEIGRSVLTGHDFFSSNRKAIEEKYFSISNKMKSTVAVFGDVAAEKNRIFCLFYDRPKSGKRKLTQNKVGEFEVNSSGLVFRNMYELKESGYYVSITVKGDTLYAFDNSTKEIQSFKLPEVE